MDYREALSFKVMWEKETKPSLKEMIEELKETAADNKRMLSNCLEDHAHFKHCLRFATMVRDEKEKHQRSAPYGATLRGSPSQKRNKTSSFGQSSTR